MTSCISKKRRTLVRTGAVQNGIKECVQDLTQPAPCRKSLGNEVIAAKGKVGDRKASTACKDRKHARACLLNRGKDSIRCGCGFGYCAMQSQHQKGILLPQSRKEAAQNSPLPCIGIGKMREKLQDAVTRAVIKAEIGKKRACLGAVILTLLKREKKDNKTQDRIGRQAGKHRRDGRRIPF